MQPRRPTGASGPRLCDGTPRPHRPVACVAVGPAAPLQRGWEAVGKHRNVAAEAAVPPSLLALPRGRVVPSQVATRQAGPVACGRWRISATVRYSRPDHRSPGRAACAGWDQWRERSGCMRHGTLAAQPHHLEAPRCTHASTTHRPQHAGPDAAGGGSATASWLACARTISTTVMIASLTPSPVSADVSQ